MGAECHHSSKACLRLLAGGGAIALTAALNLVLTNNLTLGPRLLVPAFEIALLVPLSIATAWT